MLLKSVFTTAAVAALLSSPSFAQLEGTAACSNGPVLMAYGDHAYCSLSSNSDIDLYRFFGERDDRVLVTLAGKTNDLDAKFEVYDAFGAPVFNSYCSTNQYYTCSTSKAGSLPSDGVYTIIVSDSGANNSGSYILDIQKIVPDVPERLVYFNSPSTVAVSHTGDHDFVSFEGSAGDTVRVSVAGLSNDLDCAYVLYAPDNSTVDSKSCSTNQYYTCSVTSGNLVLPLSGTYNLMLWDSGNDNTGSLSVTVSCLFGTCPPNWTSVGTSYCTATANSTGNPGTMRAWGSTLASDEKLFLYGSNVPPNVPGLFFMSPNQVNLPLGNGTLCVGGPQFRLGVLNSANGGQLKMELDFNALYGTHAIAPSTTMNFQCWFRDTAAGGALSNLTDGLSIQFQ